MQPSEQLCCLGASDASLSAAALDVGVVQSAVDTLHRLPDIVRQVATAAGKYAPMMAVLSSTA